MTMSPSFCPLCSAPLEAQGDVVACSRTGERLPLPALEMIRSNLFSEPPFASTSRKMLYDAAWYCARCGRQHGKVASGGLWSTDLHCEACERQYAQGTALTIIQLFRPSHDREAALEPKTKRAASPRKKVAPPKTRAATTKRAKANAPPEGAKKAPARKRTKA